MLGHSETENERAGLVSSMTLGGRDQLRAGLANLPNPHPATKNRGFTDPLPSPASAPHLSPH